MEYQSLDEFAASLQAIKSRGFVQTHRAGDTGVGKTLEDLCGISENNDAEADISVGDDHHIELKSIRSDSSNPVTLFTKEPPRDARRLWGDSLIDEVGYEDSDGRYALYSTLTVDSPNPQGLFLTLDDDHVCIEHETFGICARYPCSVFQRKFEEKFPELVIVTADRQGTGKREFFWYNEAEYLTGFSPDAFYELLQSHALVAETRMHLRPDGTLRNHGTAWRIQKGALPDLFLSQTGLLSAGDVSVPTGTHLGQRLLTDFS